MTRKNVTTRGTGAAAVRRAVAGGRRTGGTRRSAAGRLLRRYFGRAADGVAHSIWRVGEVVGVRKRSFLFPDGFRGFLRLVGIRTEGIRYALGTVKITRGRRRAVGTRTAGAGAAFRGFSLLSGGLLFVFPGFFGGHVLGNGNGRGSTEIMDGQACFPVSDLNRSGKRIVCVCLLVKRIRAIGGSAGTLHEELFQIPVVRGRPVTRVFRKIVRIGVAKTGNVVPLGA